MSIELSRGQMHVATPLYPPLSGGQVSTPQNRTYRVWRNIELPKYFIKLHEA